MNELYGDPFDVQITQAGTKPEDVPEQGEDDEADDMPPTPNPLRLPDAGHLEETWWLLDDERADLSDRLEKAGDSLEKTFFNKYHIKPVTKDTTPKMMTARFEFPQFGQNFQFPDGKLDEESGAVGWIDYLTGFPMRNIEMVILVGEYASRFDRLDAEYDPEKGPVPLILPTFPFEGVADEDKIAINYLFIDHDSMQAMADGIGGEPEPEGLHWWFRINLKEKEKYPVPGEFLALTYRGWPSLPGGEQETSPVVFSGNWMDTVFYTSGTIVSKIQDDPYPKYKVQWRKNTYDATPTDFAEYVAGERVTILKKVPDNKPSQLWKDEDADRWQAGWRIAPIMFYQINPREN